MEKILAQCENVKSMNNSNIVSDEEDKDYQSVAKAIEDNLLDSRSESESEAVNGESSNEKNTERRNAKANDVETSSKSDNMSFDGDIILPSVRHDPELEQKHHDRIKRKEMKSKRELEEEEREKMQ